MKINKLKNNVFTLLFGLALSSGVQAKNYYVNDNSGSGDVVCTAVGNDANSGLSPLMPKASLASVLSTYASQFVAGDVIYIDKGFYQESNLSSPINGVTIIGAGIKNTIIRMKSSDTKFMLVDDNNTTLSDFTLYGYFNQTGTDGQALAIAANTQNVMVKNVLVTSSTTDAGWSFPIQVNAGASVTFDGGGAVCNTFNGGGGMQVLGATTKVNISNYQFLGNRRSVSNQGTALQVTSGLVNVKNTRFENNEQLNSQVGSAIMVLPTGTVNVVDCYFSNNKTLLTGSTDLHVYVGGSIVVFGGKLRIARSIISNHMQTSSGFSRGAGIAVKPFSQSGTLIGGTAIIDSCVFVNNNGSVKWATDVYCASPSTIIATNSSFGSAAPQVGGGLFNSSVLVLPSFTLSQCGTPVIGTFTTTIGASLSAPRTVTAATNVNPMAANYTPNPTLPSLDLLKITGTYSTCAGVASMCNAPTIISLAPNNKICSGQTFTTNLVSTTGASTTYSWKSASVSGVTGHATSGTGNINETLVSAASKVVIYTVTPTNGTCVGAKRVYSVQILAGPVVSVTGNTSICVGKTTTLTATGGGTYLWNTGVNTRSLVVNGTTVGNSIYTVAVTATTGCSATKITTVQVKPNPTINISGELLLCPGVATKLTATGGGTYLWSQGAVKTATLSVPSASLGVKTVTVTGTNGCVGTASVNVALVGNVVASFTVDPCTCSIQNTSTISPATLTSTALWTVTNTTTNTVVLTTSASSIDLTTLPNGSYSVKLRITYNNGKCSTEKIQTITNDCMIP